MFVQYASPRSRAGAFHPPSGPTNMKLFWTMALGIAAAATAACTPMEWVRPDADPEQVQADSQQCRMQAWQEARWRAFEYRAMAGPLLYRDALGRTYLAARPYDAFGDPYMEEMRLAGFCMRAKGYELQPTN